jgi:peptide/nickel transport system substrate-binding protein
MKMRILSAAVAALFVIGGGASAQDLRIGLQDDPDTLDPAKNFSFVGRHVLSSICDKLVDITPDQKIVPQLALSWEISADGKALDLKLRPSVKFHDGEKFDAAAVKFNIERMLTMPDSRRKSEISLVTAAEVVDDLTVRLRLSAPFAPLMAQFTDRAGMMVSPKGVQTGGEGFGNKPICAGPYRLVQRIVQDRIVLEKFPEYWNAGAYHFKTITFTGIPDATVRLANLRSGQLDLIERLAATNIPTVKGDPKLKVVPGTGLGYQGILYNIANGDAAKGPFGANPKLREALDLAIDRDAVNQVVFAGAFMPGNQAFPPGTPFYNQSIPMPKRDVAKAKALVKESGVANPTLTILVPSDNERQLAVQVIQSMAKEAGIEVKLQAVELISMLAQQRQGNFEATFYGWSGRVDPDGNLHFLLTCNAPTNDPRYCNPELDAALNEARTKNDTTQRKTLYDKALAILARDRPLTVIYHQPWIFAHAAKLDGFTPYPDGIIRLGNVKFK